MWRDYAFLWSPREPLTVDNGHDEERWKPWNAFLVVSLSWQADEETMTNSIFVSIKRFEDLIKSSPKTSKSHNRLVSFSPFHAKRVNKSRFMPSVITVPGSGSERSVTTSSRLWMARRNETRRLRMNFSRLSTQESFGSTIDRTRGWTGADDRACTVIRFLNSIEIEPNNWVNENIFIHVSLPCDFITGRKMEWRLIVFVTFLCWFPLRQGKDPTELSLIIVQHPIEGHRIINLYSISLSLKPFARLFDWTRN